MRMWRRRHDETPMELYARAGIKVYAHITFHRCGCVTAWDVKGETYATLKECANHG